MITPDQRLALILTAIGLVGGLAAWILRLLVKVTSIVARSDEKDKQRDDDISENTQALKELTEKVGTLSEKMAATEATLKSQNRGARGR